MLLAGQSTDRPEDRRKRHGELETGAEAAAEARTEAGAQGLIAPHSCMPRSATELRRAVVRRCPRTSWA